MRNVTFRADEEQIERARSIARAQRKTLNVAFREWLAQYTASADETREFDVLMKRMWHVDAGRRFSRNELNE